MTVNEQFQGNDAVPPAQPPKAIRQNIITVLRLESAALRQRTHADKAADAIAAFTGTIAFVALHLVWFGIWATIDLGALSIIRPFDPYPFQLLCMIVSMEGVLLATFVLIKQNRMGYLSDRRAHLDLQINLLSEQEVTRLLQMTDRIAEKLGVDPLPDETKEFIQDTPIETMVQELDRELSSDQS